MIAEEPHFPCHFHIGQCRKELCQFKLQGRKRNRKGQERWKG